MGHIVGVPHGLEAYVSHWRRYKSRPSRLISLTFVDFFLIIQKSMVLHLRGEPFEVRDDELVAQGSKNIALGF